MENKKIDIGKYTRFAMKGLVMDDQTVQVFKMITNEYMIVLKEAMDNGKTKDEAHKIATNILIAQFRSHS